MDPRARFLFVFPLAALILWGCGAKGGGGEAADSGDKADASAPAAVELATATTRTMETLVSAPGTFAPAQGASVKVGAIAAGRIAKIFVKEGDSVSAGELVALLDNRMQAAQTQSASAALSVAEIQAKESELNARSAELDQAASVRTARLGLETAQAERDLAVKQATYDLETAQVELKKAQAGNRSQEVVQAEQAARQARANRDAAVRDEHRNALLLEKGIVSQKAYDDSKTALETAEANLKAADSQASLVREGSRQEDLQAARLKVDSAKQALQGAKDINERKVAQAETALHQAEQGVLQVQAKRQEAVATQRTIQQKLADANAAGATQAQLEVRSPIAGRVVRRLLNPGDTPDNTAPIMEIVSLQGGIDFVANLSTADAGKVHPGQKAYLTVSGQADAKVEGSLVSVGQVDPQTGLLAVRIRVISPPKWLQPGTFGSAQIVVREHRGAVVVPKVAVVSHEGDSVVYLAKGDKAAMTKVEVGAEEDGFLEILSGLNAGQQVVTTGNYELADGAAIKTGDSEAKDAGAKDGDAKDAGDKKGADDKKDAADKPADKPDADDKKAGK